MDVKRLTRGPAIWVIVFVVLLIIGARVFAPNQFKKIDTSRAISLIEQSQVDSAKLVDGDQRVELTLKSSAKIDGYDKVEANYIDQRGDEMVQLLTDHPPAKGFTDEVPRSSWWSSLLIGVLPLILLLAVFWFLMGQMQGGGSRVMNFGKSRAKLVSKDTPKVTFADVAGAEEAVEELHEIKEFLAEPAKFQAVGAKIPKGVLLYGQP
ncbi:ATP-dependent metallopeptidase FtsH/Yme1/Tma family protein, partial [Actinoplanes sp. NPDC049599]|uniref:ATP-dependent metallopeptidase FtsH/Yme1/Tma family protein n=1 Tax=Actinoplanes sp. NPDC049599 TaxID=3363903 RepID=UPI0037B64BBA